MSYRSLLKHTATIQRFGPITTLTLATVTANTTVTINSIVFTAHATTTTAASRQFSISGTDTADAAALAGLINHATYGVSGVTATAALGVITLQADASTTITATTSAATVTISDTDNYGKPRQAWQTLASSVPCRRMGLQGRELIGGPLQNAIGIERVYLEYGQSIAEKDRMVIGGDTLEVEYVDKDAGGAQHHKEVLVRAVRP